MRQILLFTVGALCCASVGMLHAQEPSGNRSMFSNEALQRALPPETAAGPGQPDPRYSWDRVRELRRSTEILLTTHHASARTCRFLSADDRLVTVVDVEAMG